MIGCKVCYAIKTTNEDDSKSIIKALSDPLITNVELAKVLTDNNFPVSESSIRRHLRHKDSV